MRSEPNQSLAASLHLKAKLAAGGALLFLLASGSVPCGRSQQSPPVLSPPVSGPSVQNPAPPPSLPVSSPSPSPDVKQRQLAIQSEQLLKLATELKAEVDKSTKDTLSVAVIRKADAIARVAHGMKEQIRVDTAAN